MGRYLSEKGPWTQLSFTPLTTPEATKEGVEGFQVARITSPRYPHHIDAQLELDISSLDLTGVVEQLPDDSESETQKNLTQRSPNAPPVAGSQDVRTGQANAAGARSEENTFVEFELELGVGGWHRVGMWSRSL